MCDETFRQWIVLTIDWLSVNAAMCTHAPGNGAGSFRPRLNVSSSFPFPLPGFPPQEHTGRVFRLQFDEFQIVSSSHDDTILVWDFLNCAPAPPPDEGQPSPVNISMGKQLSNFYYSQSSIKKV